MGGCFFRSDDAVVDGANGAPPGDGDQGNVGGNLVHAGVQAVLVRRYVPLVSAPMVHSFIPYSFYPPVKYLFFVHPFILLFLKRARDFFFLMFLFGVVRLSYPPPPPPSLCPPCLQPKA